VTKARPFSEGRPSLHKSRYSHGRTTTLTLAPSAFHSLRCRSADVHRRTTMPTFSYCRSRKVIGFHCNGAKMPRENHTNADELARTLAAHRMAPGSWSAPDWSGRTSLLTCPKHTHKTRIRLGLVIYITDALPRRGHNRGTATGGSEAIIGGGGTFSSTVMGGVRQVIVTILRNIYIILSR
jgi:hypothetical protein